LKTVEGEFIGGKIATKVPLNFEPEFEIIFMISNPAWNRESN